MTEKTNRGPVAPVLNALLSRSALLSEAFKFDTRRDIMAECGYPKTVSTAQFREMYDREGVGTRVVSIYPEESWSVDPALKENQEVEESEFEEAVKQLDKDKHLFHYLERIDELSGIGRFGILLLGLDDGLELNVPVPGWEKGEPEPKDNPEPMPKPKKLDKPIKNEDEEEEEEPKREKFKGERELLYIRAFDESLVNISEFDKDPSSPRYGLPVKYNVCFADPNDVEGTSQSAHDATQKTVHWSRVIHVADNRKSSEVFGAQRQRPVWNRLQDLQKLLGGSAEMFWKGAFPGYSFEVNPELGDTELDTDAVKEEFEKFSNSLQRYIALEGVQTKSLASQVASPEAHVMSQLRAICITIGVPLRIFMGSEQAQLASSQDSRHWNKKIKKRQSKYLTPHLVRPMFDRLILLGCLPPVEEYEVEWEDLNAPSDLDKATVTTQLTEAMAKYVSGGLDALVPPLEFLTMFIGLDTEQAEEIIEAAHELIEAEETLADLTGPSEEDIRKEEQDAAAMKMGGMVPPGLPPGKGKQPPKFGIGGDKAPKAGDEEGGQPKPPKPGKQAKDEKK